MKKNIVRHNKFKFNIIIKKKYVNKKSDVNKYVCLNM